MTSAKRLGERKIIEAIWKQLDKPPRLPVPFGDDVSAVEYKDGELAVLKTDMLVGRTDVPTQMSYWQAARKAVVMNVSDFAAKGVQPLALLVSLGIPPNFERAEIEQIGKGLNMGARKYNVHVLGGDTNEADDLIINITLFGLSKKKKLILRSGAQPGDIVATTGLFGLTLPGLALLKWRETGPPEFRDKFIDAVLMPSARLREGLALAKTNAISAAIDSSDGLAWSLHEISRASNVGFIIDNPPIAPETFKFAKTRNLDPFELGFYGGEEYELIVTINPRHYKKAERAVEKQGGKLHKIGKATAKDELLAQRKGKLVKLKKRGYEHFKHGGRKVDSIL
ncbi:MAG: thiamine-phosphate kinase [Candidatus Bathyarchaeota archaeon]|nr:MAG: thiamine-phosphate kinase [Candidatus Bathyarchaeota archaeon]